MKPVRALIGRELTWHRTRLLPPAYELRADSEPAARLVWQSAFRSTVRAETAEGEWRFRRPALFTRRVLVEDAGTGALLAEYTGSLRGGRLRTADQRELRFSRVGFIPRTVRVSLDSGSEVLIIAWRWIGLRIVARMDVPSAGTAEPALGLLACLAFYILLQRRRRAAASSGG